MAAPPCTVCIARDRENIFSGADVSDLGTELVGESESHVSETQPNAVLGLEPVTAELGPDEALSGPISGLECGIGLADVSSVLEDHRTGPESDEILMDGPQLKPVGSLLHEVGPQLVQACVLPVGAVRTKQYGGVTDLLTLTVAVTEKNTAPMVSGKLTACLSLQRRQLSYFALWQMSFTKIKRNKEREAYEKWKRTIALVPKETIRVDKSNGTILKGTPEEVILNPMSVQEVKVHRKEFQPVKVTGTWRAGYR